MIKKIPENKEKMRILKQDLKYKEMCLHKYFLFTFQDNEPEQNIFIWNMIKDLQKDIKFIKSQINLYRERIFIDFNNDCEDLNWLKFKEMQKEENNE
ncbi:hypothetical protein [Spiroplasma endosymbiont of Villa modesta]|uniref:hypothetical protein n=1 Tax=Spiroplasma endosymbiont of Villa modesta TaxID=3066293 RepID=UPI00313F2140